MRTIKVPPEGNGSKKYIAIFVQDPSGKSGIVTGCGAGIFVFTLHAKQFVVYHLCPCPRSANIVLPYEKLSILKLECVLYCLVK